jgi:hypothetical protein
MSNNPFLILGFVGIAVTFSLQLIIIYILDNKFGNWWVFYAAWFVFLLIGIVRTLKKRKN